MKTNVFAMLALAVLANCPGSAATVYDSSTGPDNGTTYVFTALGYSQIGDSITLGGSERLLQSATVRFYNLGDSGTFDATLRFWELGTLPSVVGSQIGSDYITKVSLDSFDSLNVTFSGLNLLVPGSLVFTIEVSNLSTNTVDPGLIAHTSDPTNIGSSNDAAIIGRVGSDPFISAPTAVGEGNPYLVLDAAVPEPATITMAAAALLLFVARKRSTR